MASLNQMRKPAVDPAQEQDDTATDESGGDPKSKENLDRLVTAARALVNQSSKEILSMLSSGKDRPAQALASTVEMVMTVLSDQAGGELPQDVVLDAGEKILDDLGEEAQAAGLFQYTPKVKGQTIQILMAEVVKGADPEDVKAAISDVPLDKLKEMLAQQNQIATPEEAQPDQSQPVPAMPDQQAGVTQP